MINGSGIEMWNTFSTWNVEMERYDKSKHIETIKAKTIRGQNLPVSNRPNSNKPFSIVNWGSTIPNEIVIPFERP